MGMLKQIEFLTKLKVKQLYAWVGLWEIFGQRHAFFQLHGNVCIVYMLICMYVLVHEGKLLLEWFFSPRKVKKVHVFIKQRFEKEVEKQDWLDERWDRITWVKHCGLVQSWIKSTIPRIQLQLPSITCTCKCGLEWPISRIEIKWCFQTKLLKNLKVHTSLNLCYLDIL